LSGCRVFIFALCLADAPIGVRTTLRLKSSPSFFFQFARQTSTHGTPAQRYIGVPRTVTDTQDDSLSPSFFWFDPTQKIGSVSGAGGAPVDQLDRAQRRETFRRSLAAPESSPREQGLPRFQKFSSPPERMWNH